MNTIGSNQSGITKYNSITPVYVYNPINNNSVVIR